MPIVVRAVTPQEFDAWLVQAKTKFADAGNKATASAASLPATTQSATTESPTTGSAGMTQTGVTPVRVTGAKPFSLLAAAQVQR
jgi:hypothetical protein